MQNQIFITMEGGLIQHINVTRDLEKARITVIDYDIEGTPDEELTKIDDLQAIIFRFHTDIIKKEALWKNILTGGPHETI